MGAMPAFQYLRDCAGPNRGGWGVVGVGIGVAVERPFDAHEEEAEGAIDVLIGVEDVGSVLVKERGDAGDETFLVGAVDEEDGGVFHGARRE